MKNHEIPKELIAHYLGHYVDELYEKEDRDLYDPSLAEECFGEIKLGLMKFGEQEFLAAGLKKLITDIPSGEYMNFSNQESSLTDEDMEYIVKTLYKKTKPTSFNENSEINITNQKLIDWRFDNGFYYKIEAGDTLSKIAKKIGITEETIALLNKPDFEECGLNSPLTSEFVIVQDRTVWI